MHCICCMLFCIPRRTLLVVEIEAQVELPSSSWASRAPLESARAETCARHWSCAQLSLCRQPPWCKCWSTLWAGLHGSVAILHGWSWIACSFWRKLHTQCMLWLLWSKQIALGLSFKALRVEGLLIRGIFPPIASFLKLGLWVTEGSIQPTSTLSFPTVEPLIVETKSSRKYKITNSREILDLKKIVMRKRILEKLDLISYGRPWYILETSVLFHFARLPCFLSQTQVSCSQEFSAMRSQEKCQSSAPHQIVSSANIHSLCHYLATSEFRAGIIK